MATSREFPQNSENFFWPRAQGIFKRIRSLSRKVRDGSFLLTKTLRGAAVRLRASG